MRMLVVDDNLDVRELFKEYFSLFDHDVSTAATASEALELVTSQQFEAIVLDLTLPDLDGYALASRIRRLLAFKVRPAMIAVASTPFDHNHPCVIEAAFDTCLMKPVNLDVLESALQRYSISSRLGGGADHS